MQRLANANASDRLAGALNKLGRLMKTLHILRYIQEEPLRDAIQLQLNRGEFRHILAKSCSSPTGVASALATTRR